MANKMLIDATHPEETRVVVLRGNRVEEFDFESAQRKQLRGNIYLAKVTRVEPSLQAAFVDYGGNRHGFLAFSEIHPDYYQIPVADRQALIDEEERAQRDADEEVDRRSRRHRHHGPRHDSASHRRRDEVVRSEASDTHPGETDGAEQSGPAPLEGGEAIDQHSEFGSLAPAGVEETASTASETPEPPVVEVPGDAALGSDVEPAQAHGAPVEADSAGDNDSHAAGTDSGPEHDEPEHASTEVGDSEDGSSAEPGEASSGVEAREHDENGEEEEIVESVGGSDALEEVPDRAPRYRRQYKIQEVIKRRQVMLVQVVKEERGTKGAALTTYLSLAGRYSVLMPNTARGGGISRKITSSEDRARLKEAASELEVPEGMGVILRTAGANRTKIEIKRDFEYLLRMWETVRDLTLKSTAPKLVYEEGSLVKRSIRDLYSKDIDEVIVAGTEAYHEAKDFMRMLMPSHAKNVKPYADTQPLLSRFGVESQLDAMFSPVVQLRSGGYIVLNQAEALVAIDVNSGRATREHHIEDTALKTNLEASDEIARQLRLRDLAGLIVIDYIDMDEKRNNRAVERRLKESLKHDRARIQVGRISHFGLLEMSRQRIRSSVLESSTEKCPHCGGTGHVRSVSSLALQVLRALEEQMIKGATHNLIARTRPDVALYVLNQKRAHLRSLEERFAITITVSADESVVAPQAFVIDRGELVHTVEAAKAIAERAQIVAAPLEDDDELEDYAVVADDEVATEAEGDTEAPAIAPEQDEDRSRPRRRRRRRGGRNGGEGAHGQPREPVALSETGDDGGVAHDDVTNGETAGDDELAEGQPNEFAPNAAGEAGDQRHDGERRRRRGRRGGRRNRQRNGDAVRGSQEPGNQEPGGQEFGGQELGGQELGGQELGGQAHGGQEAGGQDSSSDHQGIGESSGDASAPRGEEPNFAPARELIAPPATESELKEAVADLDTAQRAAPTPAAPAAESEPARRRSTVRERAPIGGDAETPSAPTPSAPPAPEPVIAETGDAPASDRPRRTGWWSRRFAGG